MFAFLLGVLSVFVVEFSEHIEPPMRFLNKLPTPPANWLNFTALDHLSFVETFAFVVGIAVADGPATYLTRRLETITLIGKHIAIALSVIMTTLSLASPYSASAQTDAENEKVRAKVQILSASRDSQVEVKFRDKTKIKGYITAVEPVSFTLRDPKSGAIQSIAYSEVDSVSKASVGVSTKTWLIIGGVAAGVATTWLIVKPAVCDGGAQTRGVC